jgi:hypothetical protein
MAARSFVSGCSLTADQLAAINLRGISSNDVANTSCTATGLNTCGRDAQELVIQYPLYDPARGVYTKWGDIPVPWNHEDSVSDERWQVASYTDEFAYRIGDKVIVLKNDGLTVVVYEAIANVPVPAGAFYPAHWAEVCRVTVSEPVGLPDVTTLLAKYDFYNPKSFLTAWSEFASDWNEDLTAPDSDEWDEAKIAKTYFYRSGDTVLWNTRCDDYTCVYVAIADMPANPDLVVPGPPPATYFSRLYCIRNGNPSTCGKTISCGPGRVVVDLGRNGTDLVCVPVESDIGVGPRTNGH